MYSLVQQLRDNCSCNERGGRCCECLGAERIATLEAALKKHGSHDEFCFWFEQADCNCGLEAAIRGDAGQPSPAGLAGGPDGCFNTLGQILEWLACPLMREESYFLSGDFHADAKISKQKINDAINAAIGKE